MTATDDEIRAHALGTLFEGVRQGVLTPATACDMHAREVEPLIAARTLREAADDLPIADRPELAWVRRVLRARADALTGGEKCEHGILRSHCQVHGERCPDCGMRGMHAADHGMKWPEETTAGDALTEGRTPTPEMLRDLDLQARDPGWQEMEQ